MISSSEKEQNFSNIFNILYYNSMDTTTTLLKCFTLSPAFIAADCKVSERRERLQQKSTKQFLQRKDVRLSPIKLYLECDYNFKKLHNLCSVATNLCIL